MWILSHQIHLKRLYQSRKNDYQFLKPYLQNKTLQIIFIPFDHLLPLRCHKFFAAFAAHTTIFPCLNFCDII